MLVMEASYIQGYFVFESLYTFKIVG